MAKKGSKAVNGGRRSSVMGPSDIENENIAIVNHNEDVGKFSVIRSAQQETKQVKSWEELKKECTSLEDIRNTVRRLPLDNVLPLLQELLAQFDVQQARDAVLTEWIKTVLLTHTAYFMTLPEVVQRLSTLYKELDDRLTVYPKLLAMHGRLDLIQNQIDARNRKNVESDEESDMEEVPYQSESGEDVDDEDDEDNEDDDVDDEDDLMDMDNEELKMFKEEEDDLNTEDEDDNISDSDIEE
ncbi:unnamed protein product [Mucor circinelloides]|uniref:Small-subunit processome Utp12 domain-containing protein n=1 Tax=Mucor circinelloides f. circinelloides (strain 1006PhL) TaxID=1220926 RepID=S2JWI0_MUCC1|nr:hypothetical protein HMPREF1544_00226 [Mucor circinelloides 1006PhL]